MFIGLQRIRGCIWKRPNKKGHPYSRLQDGTKVTVPYSATSQISGKDEATNLQMRLGSACCSQSHSKWLAWRNEATVKLWLAKRKRGRDFESNLRLCHLARYGSHIVTWVQRRLSADLGAALAHVRRTCTGFVTLCQLDKRWITLSQLGFNTTFAPS